MQVKCIARIHDVYQQSNERFIEEDRPRVTSLTSSNNHIGLTYNSYNPENNEIEEKENYIDNIKGKSIRFEKIKILAVKSAKIFNPLHYKHELLRIRTIINFFTFDLKFIYC